MEADDILKTLLGNYGYRDFRLIKGSDIVVAPWVRLKCQFGCSSYGKLACCPPNTSSVDECVQIFKSYERAVIFRFNKCFDIPEERHQWSWKINRELLTLEKKLFCAGYHKAFLLFMDSCAACLTCMPTRIECKQPDMSRPSPEGMAVDVFQTVRKAGYEITVLKDLHEEMNRFAFLLVE